jgi:hypothetical protein
MFLLEHGAKVSLRKLRDIFWVIGVSELYESDLGVGVLTAHGKVG